MGIKGGPSVSPGVEVVFSSRKINIYVENVPERFVRRSGEISGILFFFSG